ncbi:MAG: protein-L-isoaspartate O-methyltransferase [Hyphomicrobiaceae bacterium]
MTSDYAIQRLNMVESQVRPSDIVDRRITRAMQALARERFVPKVSASICYTDRDILLGKAEGDDSEQRFMLAPRVQAKMIQALLLGDGGRALDVACGTGYTTAVLARMTETVIGLEVIPDLAAEASRVLAEVDANNAKVVQGDLAEGVAGDGPYDGILINGAIDHSPEVLLDQLKDGGRLVAVLRERQIGRVTVWQRNGGVFSARALFDATAPVLNAFRIREAFVF